MQNPVNRAPYSYHGEYSPIFTMVNCMSLADVPPLYYILLYPSRPAAAARPGLAAARPGQGLEGWKPLKLWGCLEVH